MIAGVDLQGALTAALPSGRFHRLGVAVSGGGDSLALLHLLHGRGFELCAATVDHGLRAGSGAEADAVAAHCGRLGVAHDRLDWTGWDGAGNLQDQARRARYRLLAEWGRGRGVDGVALGHTLDDQAETFLMRLARRSGVDGLAQMAGEFQSGGMVFLRPLLACRRADLRQYLADNGEVWAEDPSNDDPRFDRVKARRALAVLADLGVDAEGIGQVAAHMAMARDALGQAAATAAGRIARLEAGDLVFDCAALLELSPELFRRLMAGALRYLAGSHYAPRSEPVQNLRARITAGKADTLHGCRILVKRGVVRITREPAAVAGLRCASDGLWDRRWRLQGLHAPDLRIGALGEAGLAQCKGWRETGVPRESLLVSPAIWRENALISAPIAGFANGWCAEGSQSCDEYVNSLITH